MSLQHAFSCHLCVASASLHTPVGWTCWQEWVFQMLLSSRYSEASTIWELSLSFSTLARTRTSPRKTGLFRELFWARKMHLFLTWNICSAMYVLWVIQFNDMHQKLELKAHKLVFTLTKTQTRTNKQAALGSCSLRYFHVQQIQTIWSSVTASVSSTEISTYCYCPAWAICHKLTLIRLLPHKLCQTKLDSLETYRTVRDML